MPCFAEMSTNMVLPPYSSGTRPYSVSWPRTLSGLAPGLSILLTATTIGHMRGLGVVDGFHGLRHDAVVGGDHEDRDVGEFGATARIAVKASWPGVSRNVIFARLALKR